jgi:uncharacterized protein YndB with AHSA1/START domain
LCPEKALIDAEMGKRITIRTLVDAPVKVVWNSWTMPEHVVRWNHASEDWHTTRAVNDLQEGGRFSYRMEAKDGSFSFDFSGIYANVEPFRSIGIILDDGRIVQVGFSIDGTHTRVVETFETEDTNPPEMQRNGWQAILDNFKKYTESLNKEH